MYLADARCDKYTHTYMNNVLTSAKQYRINTTARFTYFAQLNTIHLRVRTSQYESHYRSLQSHPFTKVQTAKLKISTAEE